MKAWRISHLPTTYHVPGIWLVPATAVERTDGQCVSFEPPHRNRREFSAHNLLTITRSAASYRPSPGRHSRPPHRRHRLQRRSRPPRPRPDRHRRHRRRPHGNGWRVMPASAESPRRGRAALLAAAWTPTTPGIYTFRQISRAQRGANCGHDVLVLMGVAVASAENRADMTWAPGRDRFSCSRCGWGWLVLGLAADEG